MCSTTSMLDIPVVVLLGLNDVHHIALLADVEHNV